jgi:hypothetical protein
MKIEQYKNIKQFLSENRTELWNKLTKQDIIDPDYWNITDMDFSINGYYETADDNGEIDLVESEHICALLEGMDLSFDRKYVSNVYGNGQEGVENIHILDYQTQFEIEVNGKMIYGLKYNV